MASIQNQLVFQCSGCQEELDLESKTLQCLHSFCRSCLDKHFEGETNGNGQCPECHEHLTLDQSSLSPFLVKSLRRRQLETSDWKCDLCSEDRIESIAKNWCHDCQKVFCANCSRFHEKFHPEHDAKDLDGMEKDVAIELMTTDMCYLHHKEEDSYCEQCNGCFCDICYQNHTADSPGCSSRPLVVRDEALKQKSRGPRLAKEMDNLDQNLRLLNDNMKNYTAKLDSDCDAKCTKLWIKYREMMKMAKKKTHELCEDVIQMTAKQVEQWRHLLVENENILKRLEIWRINLKYLLNESQQDVNVVCGLQLLRSKLSSKLHKSVSPEKKCKLVVTFSDWWLQFMQRLTSQKIGSVSWPLEELPVSENKPIKKLGKLPVSKNKPIKQLGELPVSENKPIKRWTVRGSNPCITSIHIDRKDGHIFIGDCNSHMILEYTQNQKFVCECRLSDGTNKYSPFDMCSISPDILVVACGWENKLIFLERKKIQPFLEIKKFSPTKEKYLSLCEMNNVIFACDNFFQVDSFTKGGEKIKTIRILGDTVKGGWPLIRADPSSGNCWGTSTNPFEINCFNSNGKELKSRKMTLGISDFCVNEFGHIYFSNFNGIFSSSGKKVCKFKKKYRSNFPPKIFVLRDKAIVCLQTAGQSSIEIFKITD